MMCLQEVMEDLESWREKLEQLKRMPRPAKSHPSPIASWSPDSPQPQPVRDAPLTAPPGYELRRRPSDFFLKAPDRKLLENSYQPVKDVERFLDSPPLDLPHRPGNGDHVHVGGMTHRSQVTRSKSLDNEDKNSDNLSDGNEEGVPPSIADVAPPSTARRSIVYTSGSMTDLTPREPLLTKRRQLTARDIFKLRLFHRTNTDADGFRSIPECLDTTSEFFNPSVSADERFEKYLAEMKRKDQIESEIQELEAKGPIIRGTKYDPGGKGGGWKVLPNIHDRHDIKFDKRIPVSTTRADSLSQDPPEEEMKTIELLARMNLPATCR